MSILTGFKKVKNYILTSSGYQLLSRWTSSQTVEFDDGKTAQAKLGEINGIAKTYVDMKKATDNSMAASAKAVMEGLENSSALISMTQAEYDALSDEERTDNYMRAILDANPDVVDAKNVNFDNTDTNLTATNTQSAITELNGKLATNLCEKNILVNERIKSACTIKIPDYKSYKFLMVIIKGDGNNGISICIPTIMMYTSDSGIPFSLYSTNGSIAISQSGYTIVAQGEVVTGNVKVSYLNIAQWNQAQVIVYGIN